MKKTILLTLATVCAMAGAMAASSGAAPDIGDDGDDGFYENWIEGRLSLGLTYSYYTMKNGKRPANREEDFLGNINQLKASKPSRVFPTLEYRTCDYLTIGFSYMHVEASTKNFNNGEGDGNAIMKGPTFAADLTYPLLDGMIIPHVGAGLAVLSGDFREDTWWGLGYSSPESWTTLGRPSSKTRGDHYRYIEVDDATEPFFTLGISCIPYRRLKLDVSYRFFDLDPDCEFGYDYAPRGGRKHRHTTGDFDLGGDMWLFSVSYVF